MLGLTESASCRCSLVFIWRTPVNFHKYGPSPTLLSSLFSRALAHKLSYRVVMNFEACFLRPLRTAYSVLTPALYTVKRRLPHRQKPENVEFPHVFLFLNNCILDCLPCSGCFIYLSKNSCFIYLSNFIVVYSRSTI